MSSQKGKVRNLLSSNSVAGAKLPSSQLDNPNIQWLIIPGQLLTTALTKSLYLFFYGQNCPEGILYQYSIHSSISKLF